VIVIGLNGQFRHGKSYVAKYILEMAEEEGLLAAVVSFATPLKELCKREFGWDGKKDEKGRRLLQVVGTDAGRGYDENIWVRKWVEHVKSLYNMDVILSDDMRFQNEVDAIEELGGTTCRVIRIEEDGRGYREPGMDKMYEHASEQPLRTARVITCPSGDLDSLRAFSRELFRSVRG